MCCSGYSTQHKTHNTQHRRNKKKMSVCSALVHGFASCLVSSVMHSFMRCLARKRARMPPHTTTHTHTHTTPQHDTHTHTPHSQLTWRCCCLQLEGEKAGWFCVRTHVTPNHAIPVHTIHRRIHRFSVGPQIGFPPLHRARKKGNSLLLSCVCVFLFVVCVFFVLFVCLIAHSPHNLPEVASSPGEQQASATMAQCDSK